MSEKGAGQVCFQVSFTPLGEFLVAADDRGLCFAGFREESPSLINGVRPLEKEIPVLVRAKAEVSAYFSGSLRAFTLPYYLGGTDFQRRVWIALTRIPYGKTRSYQDVAVSIANPSACRAVGHANHNNPLTLIVPCHRVIGKKGTLVGYGSGVERKEWLLNFEKRGGRR